MRRLALAALLLAPAVARAQPADSVRADAAPASGAPVFEMVEEPPALVGGLAAFLEDLVYPEDARLAGVEGRVIVQFVVDEDGRVLDPMAVRSPSDTLSAAAVAAVRAARFTPGRNGGVAVRSRFTLPVLFQLEAPEPAADAEPEDTEEPVLIGGLAGLQRRVVYPESAWREGVEGVVVVQFFVDEEGRPVDVFALKSPDARLSRAAIAAVREVQFTPGRIGGEPVRVRFTLPVAFRLGAPEPDPRPRPVRHPSTFPTHRGGQ